MTRVTVDLQSDFALNQPLSPFALAAFELLDRESETYALDMLSIVESTLDDPSKVLYAQESKAKGEAITEMKAAGIEYEERMARLETISWPKPLAELLAAAFDSYRSGHPWVADHSLSPKSVARDLYERAMTFNDFTGYYQLARSEGVVLRYLSDAFKALTQTVPEDAKTEELYDLTEWLGTLVRQVDSSLLDEWEQLRHPETAVPEESLDDTPPPVTANRRAFLVLVRNALFRRVELAAIRRYATLAELDPDWSGGRWEEALAPYFADHPSIGTGQAARSSAMVQVAEGPTAWTVRQILEDPEGFHEWAIVATVDLAASVEAGEAVVRVTGVERL